MKVGFFRKIPVAIASLVASSTAFAAMDMDSRVSQLEDQMQQVRTETAMGTYGNPCRLCATRYISFIERRN